MAAMRAYYLQALEAAREAGEPIVVELCCECGVGFERRQRYVRRSRCPDCQGLAHYVRATAGSLVNRAIYLGRLLPATAFRCMDCDEWAHQYEHRDYSKPYEVEPVCARCNCRRGPGRLPRAT